MDAQQVIDQVAEALKRAPEKLGDLTADPRGTIEGIIGQPLDGIDPAEIASGLQDKVAGLDLPGIGLSGIDLSGLVDRLPEGIKGLTGGAGISGVADQIAGMFGGLFKR